MERAEGGATAAMDPPLADAINTEAIDLLREVRDCMRPDLLPRIDKVLSEPAHLFTGPDAGAAIERRARALVQEARAAGFNVEILPRPLQPLAMRNYELAVTVWPRRP